MPCRKPAALSLLAILVCLLAQHAYPPRPRQPLMAFYGRMSLSAAKRLNAGDRNSGIAAWAALMVAVLVPVALVTALAAALHPARRVAARHRGALRHAALPRRPSPTSRASNGRCAPATWCTPRTSSRNGRASPSKAPDEGAVARLAAEHALREVHHGAFAPLFWFLVLPGPIGLVLYPLALRAAQSWEHLVDPAERDFGWFAGRAFHVIDWIPQRLTAFAFAVVGDFEDALFCWRSQAAQWVRPEEGIVLASGAGALGVRLGEPVDAAGGYGATPGAGRGRAGARGGAREPRGPALARPRPVADRLPARRGAAARLTGGHPGTALRPLLPPRAAHRDPRRLRRAPARPVRRREHRQEPRGPRHLVVTATQRQATGAAADKPAFWIDGNIHAAELTASTACLYFLQSLEEGYGKDRGHHPAARHARGLRLPAHQSRRRRMGARRPARSTSAPRRALSVRRGTGRRLRRRGRGRRRAHPHDAHPGPQRRPTRRIPRTPRLMIPRDPAESGGTYWRVIPEGTLRDYDGVDDPREPRQAGPRPQPQLSRLDGARNSSSSAPGPIPPRSRKCARWSTSS